MGHTTRAYDTMNKKLWKSLIKNYFYSVPSANAELIHEDTGCTVPVAKEALVELENEGFLSNKFGWYSKRDEKCR